MVSAAGVLLAGTAAVVVVPGAVGASDEVGEAAPGYSLPEEPGRRAAVEAVREFVRAGGAVIRCDDASGSVAFWYRDERDEGYVNGDEVVLLSYRPALGAFVASRLDDVHGFSDRVSLDADGPLDSRAIWGSVSDVVSDVVAAGFDDVRLATAGGGDGTLTLDVRFSWTVGRVDFPDEASGFGVTLPALGGWSRTP